jgi:hypothetical protein
MRYGERLDKDNDGVIVLPTLKREINLHPLLVMLSISSRNIQHATNDGEMAG